MKTFLAVVNHETDGITAIVVRYVFVYVYNFQFFTVQRKLLGLFLHRKNILKVTYRSSAYPKNFLYQNEV